MTSFSVNIDVDPYINRLEELRVVMCWLIDGKGIHCLGLEHSGGRLQNIYNMYNCDENYFVRKYNYKK